MSAHHSTPDEIRSTADLININERERDIIIKWGSFVMDKFVTDDEWSVEDHDLYNRFVWWKEQRDRIKNGT